MGLAENISWFVQPAQDYRRRGAQRAVVVGILVDEPVSGTIPPLRGKEIADTVKVETGNSPCSRMASRKAD